MVDANTGKPFSSQYARSFCGPSIPETYHFDGGIHINPIFDGKSYEEIGLKEDKKDPNQFCKSSQSVQL
jgi:hypothetical protein